MGCLGERAVWHLPETDTVIVINTYLVGGLAEADNDFEAAPDVN